MTAKHPEIAGQRVDEQPLDAGAFRQVIGRFMSGVVVITATHQGERRGMTVSAVASLSLDPPMIVTCLNAASSTQEVVRRFGRIELIQDAEAYRRLRDLILTRQVSADERLDVERLAGQLKTSPSAVQYALTRLVTENLVIREDRGHLVRPPDVATSNEAHDARMAIELGVAEMTVGRLGQGQLSGLRRLAQTTVDVLGRGDPDGIPAYALANQEFHRFLVATAGVDALSVVYEQLSIADLISRALRTQDEIEGILAREHLDLVQAYERADLDGVREVIIRHTAHAKQTQQRGIERAGGRL